MQQEEKLIYLGAGVNSRFLGIVVSSIALFFLILFPSLLFFPSFGLGNLKLKSQSINCAGINSIIQNQKMRQYEITKNVEDLPNNCKIEESSINPLFIGGISFFPLFLLFFFFRCKKIVLKGNQVYIYDGNVFVYRFQQAILDTITQIKIYPVDKKLLILPYKIAAVDFIFPNGKITLDTNLSVSKNTKDVNYFVDVLKRELISTRQSIVFSNECATE